VDDHVRLDDVRGQGQPVAGPVRLDLSAVDLEQLDLAAAEVEEERAVADDAETDRGFGAVG